MSKVHIVLDSTANVPQAMLAEHSNLHVVPLSVRLGHREWREDQIGNPDLFALVRQTGDFPKTSQPAPGEFVRTFERILEADGDIIVITLSGGLSGTIQSARTAAQSVDSRRVFAVDSGTTAIGMVKLAQQGLAMAAAGQPTAAIAARLEQLSACTHTMFVPATLEYLHKGGRIGGAAALLGTILKIRPVLYVNAGKVAVLDKVQTWNRAVNRIVEAVLQHQQPEYIGVVHIEALAEAEKLRLRLQDSYPAERISVSTGGAVLAAHLGPGLVGVILGERP